MRAGLVVAGVTSGVGKTTVTMGLIGALRRLGLRVQPFKAGPDYIDPSYLAHIAGVPCRNLDTWLVPGRGILELFARAMRNKEMAVVEGVMGLYDGRSALGEEGSTAELAKLLGLPVLLVMDVSAAARSVAATVLGFQRFDPHLSLAGVILNNVGSQHHADLCREAIEAATGLPVLGALSRQEKLALPQRHLGLVPTVEGATATTTFQEVVQAVTQNMDLSRIMALARDVPSLEEPPQLFPHRPQPVQGRIAVAMDRAFSFYYQDNLDLLEAWGAELAPFSPLEDSELPVNTSAVCIGGGFPELHAEELAANRSVLDSVREAARHGVPIYAECGGLMYLGQSLADFNDRTHPMAGLIPARSHLTNSRLTLGYRMVRAIAGGPILQKGQEVKGHEFHWSRLEAGQEPGKAAYEILAEQTRSEGFHRDSVLASYIHLHFGADPRLAPRFVRTCRNAKETLK